MNRPLILGLLLVLTACGTPQEQCIRRATGDLRVVERLIGVTEGNLQRGYALENITVYNDYWSTCLERTIAADGTATVTSRPCLKERAQTVQRPKAINLTEEAAKLDSLRTKRAQQIRQANADIGQCRVQFPEDDA